MPKPIPFDDAVELLDADHKAVKQMFIDYESLCDDQAPAGERQALAQRICAALGVHAQIEEEIFYPKVREAIDDPQLIDQAFDEHAEAKQMIADIGQMDAAEDGYDDAVKELAKVIDEHVLEEREQIFLQARNAAIDLRALAVPLYQRSQALKAQAPARAREAA